MKCHSKVLSFFKYLNIPLAAFLTFGLDFGLSEFHFMWILLVLLSICVIFIFFLFFISSFLETASLLLNLLQLILLQRSFTISQLFPIIIMSSRNTSRRVSFLVYRQKSFWNHVNVNSNKIFYFSRMFLV